MSTNTVETLVGTVVIAVAAVFLYYAYGTADARQISGYQLSAQFDRIDGIGVGTDVRIAGIKVGSVVEQSLDPATYLARVVLAVDRTVKIPDDSSVKVAMDGLLGGAYLAIVPGGSEKLLENGGEIVNTQPSIDVVGLLGQAIFSPQSHAEENGDAAPKATLP